MYVSQLGFVPAVVAFSNSASLHAYVLPPAISTVSAIALYPNNAFPRHKHKPSMRTRDL